MPGLCPPTRRPAKFESTSARVAWPRRALRGRHVSEVSPAALGPVDGAGMLELRAKHVATRGERKTCVRIFRPPGSSASCRVLRPSVHEFAGLGAFGRDDERAELATSLADGESPGLSRSRPRDLSLHAWFATADWSTTRRCTRLARCGCVQPDRSRLFSRPCGFADNAARGWTYGADDALPVRRWCLRARRADRQDCPA